MSNFFLEWHWLFNVVNNANLWHLNVFAIYYNYNNIITILYEKKISLAQIMPFKKKSHILCISTIIMPLLKKQFKLNEGTDCVYTYTCIDYPEGVFDVPCFKQHGRRAGSPWSDAKEEFGPAVDCTYTSLDAVVWFGVYKAVAMLCHIYTALCRILSVRAQAVC